jgi:hypothetical protein
MKNGNRARLLCSALLVGASALLSGCGSMGSLLGSDKEPPDEFAVVTKAPLVMPPDFNLKPPKPGAPPTNQISPTQSAETAMFSSSDPATVAASMPGSMSQGEKLLLANAGAANVDSSIRQVIAAENKNMQAADEGFTDNLMFWQKSDAHQDPNVNADAEAQKVDSQKTTPPADQTIQKDNGANNGN